LTIVTISPADPIDKVGDLIARGNIHELTNYFAPSVDLTLLDDANTYSKAQAETTLEKFFTQNRVISGKMLHKVNSGSAFRFGVAIINTDKGSFRVAFTLKMAGDNFQLVELRIETDKVK
jgi:hypothetical protein